MNSTNFLIKAGKAQLVLSAALMLTFTGCVQHGDAPQPEVTAASPAVVTQDDYTYYPNYGIYYSGSRRQYAYQESGAWVSQPAPHGVSVEALRASPSVKMDFHDSPANHHAAVVQKYPKNWKPAPSNQKDDRPEDHAAK
jgi:hypothetical protein